MTSATGRFLYAVDGLAPRLSSPVYDAGCSSRNNARTIAQWLWGGLRAQWCESLADELGAARPLTRYNPHAQEWVAGILCAAAVDAGHDKRPGGAWSRTVAAIATATGVERAAVLARYADLDAMGMARPQHVPELLRRNA